MICSSTGYHALITLIIFYTVVVSSTLPEVTLAECSYVVNENGAIPVNIINGGGANVDVGEYTNIDCS